MLPHEQRGIFHRKLLGLGRDLLFGGGGGSRRGRGRGRGGRSGGQPTAVVPHPFTGARGVEAFGELARGDCPPGSKRFTDGHCHTRAKSILLHPFGLGGTTTGKIADPVFQGTAMTTTNGGSARGRYEPMLDQLTVRRCLPGDVLDRDGFCVAKGSIPNKQRAYPRGRRPLGTPGEMAALAKAASFGRRMETTVKRMQKIGVLKKPSRPQRRITSAAQHHAGG